MKKVLEHTNNNYRIIKKLLIDLFWNYIEYYSWEDWSASYLIEQQFSDIDKESTLYKRLIIMLNKKGKKYKE